VVLPPRLLQERAYSSTTPAQLEPGATPNSCAYGHRAVSTAFASPAAGTFGNAPRSLIYGPGQQQWDIALFKNFGMGGPRKVQFRAEMFNFINHANLNGPSFDPTNSNFGRATSKSDDRRDVQLSLRFLF